jgi:hypothetical protein
MVRYFRVVFLTQSTLLRAKKKKKFEIHYRQSKYFKNNFSTEQTF